MLCVCVCVCEDLEVQEEVREGESKKEEAKIESMSWSHKLIRLVTSDQACRCLSLARSKLQSKIKVDCRQTSILKEKIFFSSYLGLPADKTNGQALKTAGFCSLESEAFRTD